VGITYKLFNPDGQPIRAVVRVKFKGSIEDKKRAALEDRRSADLTHRRAVRPGDTLPFMCFEVYGDPRHYLFVADYNRIDDFRGLTVGAPILFPPLPPPAARR
jgi:nucleoid-associated protein YgaU